MFCLQQNVKKLAKTSQRSKSNLVVYNLVSKESKKNLATIAISGPAINKKEKGDGKGIGMNLSPTVKA